MKTLIVAFMIYAGSAFGVVNLFPCDELLKNPKVEVAPGIQVQLTSNQVLVKGYLHMHWETGMEDQTGWSIIDSETETLVHPNAYLAMYPLSQNDRVFLLEADGRIKAHGIYDETHDVREVTIFGQKMLTRPNLPMLVNENSNELIIPQVDFQKAFVGESPALAIVTLDAQRMEYLRSQLKKPYEKFLAWNDNPNRWIRFGNFNFERAYFEEVLFGEVILEEIQMPTIFFDSTGAVKTSIQPAIQAFLKQENQSEVVKYNDKLYLFDQNGHFMGLVRGHQVEQSLELLKRSRSAAVVRKRIVR